MSCLCLGKSRSDKEEAIHQSHVTDYYRMMLGAGSETSLGNISAQLSDGKLNDLSTISSSVNLNPTDANALFLKYKQSSFIKALAPHIEDSIRRKSSLSELANVLHNSGHKELMNISGRDLFVALAMSSSDTVRLYNLAATVPGMSLPLIVPGPSGSSVTMWDAFTDLLSLPRGPLVVSVGTSSSRGVGKTSLLRNIGLCGSGSPRQSGTIEVGRLSSPSIDIYLQTLPKQKDTDSVLVDCSGVHSSDPTLNALLSAAAITIVHIYPKDVSDKSGPSMELKELLSRNVRPIIVLIRDSESWKPHTRALLNATLDAFKSNILTTVEVLNYLKSPTVDKVAIYKSVYRNLAPIIAKQSLGCMTPSLPLLRNSACNNTGNYQISDIISPTCQELWSILEDGNLGGRVSTKIFPFSTANTRLLNLKKDERRVREEGGAECEASLTLIAKERGSWNEFLSNCQPSRAIRWFCEKLNQVDSWGLARFAFEVNECMNVWKEPII